MFEEGKRYNFSTLAPTILGETYTNALVLGIGNIELFNVPDMYTTNTQLLSVIDNINPNLNEHRIVAFKIMDKRVYLSEAWIDALTVTPTTSYDLVITINSCTGDDETIVTNVLKGIGMTNIDIVKNMNIL